MESGAKITSAFIGSIVTPVFSFLYGDGVVTLYIMLALALFICLDWIAGIRASRKDETYGSHYGIDGVFRTFFMIMLPVGGNFVDMIFGLPPVFFGLLAGGLIIHTIQSMTANAIRAGWGTWIPEWALNKMIEWVKSELESKVQRSIARKQEIIQSKKDESDS
jgi:phage-related holin